MGTERLDFDDPTLNLHLAAALSAHLLTRDEAGFESPPEVWHLARGAFTAATRGQQVTGQDSPLPDLASMLDARSVSVLLLTLEQVAEALNVSERSVRRLVASGDLPAVKVNAATRVRRIDLDAYVASLGSGSFRDRAATKTASDAPPVLEARRATDAARSAGRAATAARSGGSPDADPTAA